MMNSAYRALNKNRTANWGTSFCVSEWAEQRARDERRIAARKACLSKPINQPAVDAARAYLGVK